MGPSFLATILDYAVRMRVVHVFKQESAARRHADAQKVVVAASKVAHAQKERGVVHRTTLVNVTG